MISLKQLQDSMASGANVLSKEGAVLGSIEQFHLDDASGDPQWVVVAPHTIGVPSFFVPLQDATLKNNKIVLAYARSELFKSNGASVS